MKRKSLILIAICVIAAAVVFPVLAFSNNDFKDVSNSSWYKSSVDFVSSNDIMNGVGNDLFDPDGYVTRGMVVTILHRMENCPDSDYQFNFADVRRGAYYADAVRWAFEKKIVNGYSQTSFGPEDYVTREQLATILYRYTISKGLNADDTVSLIEYKDSGAISSYALEAMKWAVSTKLINGIDAVTLAPQGNATRAQMATIIMRYCQNVLSYEQTEDNTVTDNKQDMGESKQEDISTPKEQESADDIETSLATIFMEDIIAKRGESAVALVSVKNNPGILGMSLSLEYDEENMTLTSASNGDAVKSVLTLTRGKELVSGCNFVWDGMDISESDVCDGEILVLTFDISNNAVLGKYPITLVCREVVDSNLNSIKIKTISGSIEIKE